MHWVQLPGGGFLNLAAAVLIEEIVPVRPGAVLGISKYRKKSGHRAGTVLVHGGGEPLRLEGDDARFVSALLDQWRDH